MVKILWEADKTPVAQVAKQHRISEQTACAAQAQRCGIRTSAATVSPRSG